MKLTPFRQGGLDSLCGVYCVINAARLAVSPYVHLSRPACEELFQLLICDLESRGQLAGVVTGGTPWQLVSRMLVQTDVWLRRRVPGLRLGYSRPFYRRPLEPQSSVTHAIREHLELSGSTAIVVLDGIPQHWSVVQAVTPKLLIMFDSDGIHRMRFSSGRSPLRVNHEIASVIPQHTYLVRATAFRLV